MYLKKSTKSKTKNKKVKGGSKAYSLRTGLRDGIGYGFLDPKDPKKPKMYWTTSYTGCMRIELYLYNYLNIKYYLKQLENSIHIDRDKIKDIGEATERYWNILKDCIKDGYLGIVRESLDDMVEKAYNYIYPRDEPRPSIINTIRNYTKSLTSRKSASKKALEAPEKTDSEKALEEARLILVRESLVLNKKWKKTSKKTSRETKAKKPEKIEEYFWDKEKAAKGWLADETNKNYLKDIELPPKDVTLLKIMYESEGFLRKEWDAINNYTTKLYLHVDPLDSHEDFKKLMDELQRDIMLLKEPIHNIWTTTIHKLDNLEPNLIEIFDKVKQKLNEIKPGIVVDLTNCTEPEEKCIPLYFSDYIKTKGIAIFLEWFERKEGMPLPQHLVNYFTQNSEPFINIEENKPKGGFESIGVNADIGINYSSFKTFFDKLRSHKRYIVEQELKQDLDLRKEPRFTEIFNEFNKLDYSKILDTKLSDIITELRLNILQKE